MKMIKILAVGLLLQFTAKAQEVQKVLDVKKSHIQWVGKKFGGSHEGTLHFKEGFLVFEKDQLVGGEFVVDMESLLVTDLEGEEKGYLEKHLKNEDFFGVDKHKEAHLKIKNVQGNLVTADLTIKNITKPLKFSIEFKNKRAAFVKTEIDRTLYGIKYKSKSFFSGLGDKVIYDDFEIQVTLIF